LLWAQDAASAGDLLAMVLGDDPDVTVIVPGFAPGALAASSCPVVEVDPEVAELEPGCDCCALRWDLVATLTRLAKRPRPPRRVVVVLDPDADVATAIQTLLGDAELRRHVVLDATVHLLDAELVPDDLAVPVPWAMAQDRSLAVADHVVARGLGRVGPERSAGIRRSLGRRAGGATLAVTPAAALEALDPPTARWTLEGTHRSLASHRAPTLAGGGERVRWMEATLPGRLDGDRLEDWLDELSRHAGSTLLRLEGRFSVRGEARPWVALGVRTTIELGEVEPAHRRPRADAASSTVRLVGEDLDPVHVRDGLADCHC
jgi:G3E family GTPase